MPVQDLAEDELTKALACQTTTEASGRVELLLEKLDLLENLERLRALGAFEVLDNIGTSTARWTLQSLAEGAAKVQQTRVARASLERFGERTKPASLP
jgi:hypothetical protein